MASPREKKEYRFDPSGVGAHFTLVKRLYLGRLILFSLFKKTKVKTRATTQIRVPDKNKYYSNTKYTCRIKKKHLSCVSHSTPDIRTGVDVYRLIPVSSSF